MSELKENDFPPLEPQPFVTEEGREIERLRAELAAMREQRDEARELYCVEAAHHSVCLRSVIDAQRIARNRGWEGLFKASDPVSPKTTAPIHREPAPTPAPPPKKCCKGGNQSC